MGEEGGLILRVSKIDTRHGTLNTKSFSNGNTLPYIGTPFGMNYFILQNQTGSNWHFNPTFPLFQGIRLTHQPSPWMGDFSSILFTPIAGDGIQNNIEGNQTSYHPNKAIFNPHYLKLELLRYQLQIELTPTKRGAKFRLTNNSSKQLGLILSTENKTKYTVNHSNKQLYGEYNQPVNDGESTLIFYFVMDFSSVDNFNLSTFENDQWIEHTENVETNRLRLSFENDSSITELSLGTSFISKEQALLNLNREVKNNTFNELKTHGANEWEYYLNKIEIEDRDVNKVNDFYHYLYRTFLFPQTFYEWDENNEAIHFDMYSETVKSGKFFTNNGYWDTYKTVYPLHSLIIPDKYKEFIEGIINFYNESGHLPKWISPDERGLMPGTLVNAVIADAAVKNLLSESQMELLLDSMVKEATISPSDNKFGRSGVEDTLKYGYVLNQTVESVNQTLDNAYSDFCIRQVAKILNKTEVTENYEKEALNYRNLFDRESGFMRSKDKNGNFNENFTPEDWAYEYTEGSAWQNGLAVYHNIQDLIDMYGGTNEFTNHLIKLANSDPVFEIGNYGMEIHEMSEMAVADFGQIAISNQPSFHIPYLFNYVGRPEYTQLLVKQLCENAFSNTFDGYPGDEDNGSLSGWYIFSMLGFYPVTPGVDEYVLGIPQFDKSIIHLENDDKFIITTQNNVIQNNFINEVKLNSKKYSKLYLKQKDIINGGQMEVRRSLLPSNKEMNKADLPYSLILE